MLNANNKMQLLLQVDVSFIAFDVKAVCLCYFDTFVSLSNVANTGYIQKS